MKGASREVEGTGALRGLISALSHAEPSCARGRRVRSFALALPRARALGFRRFRSLVRASASPGPGHPGAVGALRAASREPLVRPSPFILASPPPPHRPRAALPCLPPYFQAKVVERGFSRSGEICCLACDVVGMATSFTCAWSSFSAYVTSRRMCALAGVFACASSSLCARLLSPPSLDMQWLYSRVAPCSPAALVVARCLISSHVAPAPPEVDREDRCELQPGSAHSPG